MQERTAVLQRNGDHYEGLAITGKKNMQGTWAGIQAVDFIVAGGFGCWCYRKGLLYLTIMSHRREEVEVSTAIGP